jgi:hypothetical protein
MSSASTTISFCTELSEAFCRRRSRVEMGQEIYGRIQTKPTDFEDRVMGSEMIERIGKTDVTRTMEVWIKRACRQAEDRITAGYVLANSPVRMQAHHEMLRPLVIVDNRSG